MDELKKQLMEKIGLDEAKSQHAIEVVLGFIKEKLPPNFRGMVDSLVSGEGGGIDDALGAVKGLFGGGND